jgi:hypothetical protein
MLIVVCLARPGGAVAEVASQPATTSTAPGDDPCAPGAARRVLPAARTVREGLMLTRQEGRLLAEVEDRTERLLDDPALYMMLAHAASLPRLSADQLAGELDRPAYASLLADPEQYRARPMSMRLRVRGVRKVQPVEPACRPWRDANEGPLWCLECYNASSKRGAFEPVIVLTPQPPTLGKPDATDSDGQETYDRSVPEVEVAGVFHKLYSMRDPNDKWSDYPVLLAWQVERRAATPMKPYPLKMFFTVGMVLLGYGILRWQIRRREAMRREEEAFRPRRFEEATDDAQARSVDPLLTEAAEEHHKRKRQENGTNDPS